VSLVAYGIITVAMTLGPMGPVSALRETSVMFAAVIGRVFLHERLAAFRIVACGVVALGAICLGHAGGQPTRRGDTPSQPLVPTISPLRPPR
jgi:drug/metabolite transporter (DMT)-like permease